MIPAASAGLTVKLKVNEFAVTGTVLLSVTTLLNWKTFPVVGELTMNVFVAGGEESPVSVLKVVPPVTLKNFTVNGGVPPGQVVERSCVCPVSRKALPVSAGIRSGGAMYDAVTIASPITVIIIWLVAVLLNVMFALFAASTDQLENVFAPIGTAFAVAIPTIPIVLPST